MNRVFESVGGALSRLVIIMLVPSAALVSCSSSLGDIPIDLPAEGVSEPVSCAPADDLSFVLHCPSTPYVTSATAEDAYSALKDVATSALGVECRWVGRIIGVGIGRDGKNLNSGLSGWSMAWVAGEADDPDMLLLDTTGGVCMVQNRCSCVSAGTCPGFSVASLDGLSEPASDSPAAILAAFPSDSDDAKYDLTYDGATGNWTVLHAAGSVEPADVIETPDSVLDVDADAVLTADSLTD